MAEAKPLKLVDLGGGVGRLEELAAGDTIPPSMLPLIAGKNRVINGKMEVAQRGTIFPAAIPATYVLDRWGYFGSPAGALDITQGGSLVPEFRKSLQATVIAVPTISPVDIADLRQTVEGYNVSDLVGKTFTLSFWVKSSKVGVHCISFANTGTAGPDRTYIAEYTVNTANTAEYKTITVIGGIPNAGAWDFTNGIGLKLRWCLVAGSSVIAAKDSWVAGNFFASANQVNCLDAIGNVFAITGVQLVAGSAAIPFEHRLYGHELSLCHRYYFDPYAGITAVNVPAGMGWMGINSSLFFAEIKFPVPMRAIPTFGPVTDGNFAVGYPSSYAISTMGPIGAGTVYGCLLSGAIATWTGAACGQLYRPGASGGLPFSAEL